MFQRVGAIAFRSDLTNIHRLLEALNMKVDAFPTIHIAGTNGKGSTAHLLAAMLTAQGYRTGLYVSPHYVDFRERIRVNGKMVSRSFVVAFTEKVRPHLDSVDPSFFEITWVMALAWFEYCRVDVAVIETGMGGRLDSTNVITPRLSVITNIGMDHVAFLGDTLPKIAAEKAGIIKVGVPVVIGETQEETTPVFRRFASNLSAPIKFADQQYRAEYLSGNLTHSFFKVWREKELVWDNLEVNLAGEYQSRNLVTSLCAMEALNAHFPVDAAAVELGLRELKRLTRFMGRWQKIGESPLVIADSAHNPDGLALAMSQLLKIPAASLHIVLGMVADKDITAMLNLMPLHARYYFAKPDLPRGMEASRLRERAAAFRLYGRTYASVRAALRAARRRANVDDVIYVGGSTFVVAEVIHFVYP